MSNIKVAKAKAAYARAVKGEARAYASRRRAVHQLEKFGYHETYEHILRKRPRV